MNKTSPHGDWIEVSKTIYRSQLMVLKNQTKKEGSVTRPLLKRIFNTQLSTDGKIEAIMYLTTKN